MPISERAITPVPRSPDGTDPILFPPHSRTSRQPMTTGIKQLLPFMNTFNQPSTSGIKTEPMSRHSVFCVVPSPIHAALTVDRPKTAKFPSHSSSALLTDSKMNWHFTSNVPNKTAAAACAGPVIGDTCGWIAGIGALTIPGVGLFIAAGPIITAMSRTSNDIEFRGVCGGLIGMGIPETKAKGYEKKFSKGRFCARYENLPPAHGLLSGSTQRMP